MVPVFKKFYERSITKNDCPVSLLYVVSKVFKKLENNRLVNHLEKHGLFSGFQYGFRCFRSNTDLLTVASDRIARAFDRSRASPAVAFDISKTFDMVCRASLLHKRKSYGISGKILALFHFFSVVDDFRRFWMGSLHKNIQLMLEFLKAPF